MKAFKELAPAKLNLFLRVTGVREDGYHTLETVFQQVGLCDNVLLTLHDRGGISVRSNKQFLPTDGRNLAVRAAQAFFQAAGVENPGLYINIKKRIPVGGGMAGGSANAAAVLRGLNRAFGRPLSLRQLMAVGLGLGADVPFCIQGGAALGTGVGEVLSAIPAMPPCHIVVCRPAISVSTKAAYGLLDAWPLPAGQPSAEAMLGALANRDLAAVCRALHNDFEGPVMAQWPILAELKAWLLKNGALGALMTGTGAVVFGLYGDRGLAERARAALAQRRLEAYLTQPD